MQREFLQQACTFEPTKHHIANWYISEKLDGTRCFWDGGITRDMKTIDVPWASVTDPKTGEQKAKIKPVSTGLWSRYGNPIIAPDWFLNQLPTCFLDGELWAGRGNFQLCRSICARDTPDSRWNQITYMVYSAPGVESIFDSGQINNAHMVRDIDYDKCVEVLTRQDVIEDFQLCTAVCFNSELRFLREALEAQTKVCRLHEQVKLSSDPDNAIRETLNKLRTTAELGGEGVVLRNPSAFWVPKRHAGILKLKQCQDAEGTVIGFKTGRATNKGSRLLGAVGAIILKFNNETFDLSGLTDNEREFASESAKEWAIANPGVEAPPWAKAKHFNVGDQITFTYRELTDAGIPKEARYLRKRDSE